jgi:hypothetical protein
MKGVFCFVDNKKLAVCNSINPVKVDILKKSGETILVCLSLCALSLSLNI